MCRSLFEEAEGFLREDTESNDGGSGGLTDVDVTCYRSPCMRTPVLHTYPGINYPSVQCGIAVG